MIKYLTFFLLFGLPFIVLPFGASPFEIPKVFLAEITIILLTLIWIFQKNHTWKSFSLKEWWPFAVLILLGLTHLIFLNTPTTFFGNTFRLQGVFLLWNLLIFAYLALPVKTNKIPFYLPLLALVGLVGSSFLVSGNEVSRGVGTLGEPNSLAAAGIFLWSFLFFSQSKLIWRLIGPILALALVFASGSRSGLVALGLQIFFLFLIKFIKLSHLKSLITTLCLLILSWSLSLIEGGGWFENRAEIWQTAALSGLESPLLGHGLGNIEQSLKETSQLLNNNIRYQYVDSAHNFLLDYWVQGGIVGIAVIIWLLGQTFKKFSSQRKNLEAASLIGLLTMMSFNPMSVVILIYFWWLIGQGLVKKEEVFLYDASDPRS